MPQVQVINVVAKVPRNIRKSAFGKSRCFAVPAVQQKPLSFWQLASVVVLEGEESYTTNSCQTCDKESLKAKGEEPLTNR